MELVDLWRVGEVRISTFEGPQSIPGWVWKCWGLDFRIYEDPSDPSFLMPGWSLTHLPTGMSAGAIMDDLSVAKQIAAEYDAIGDWSFGSQKAPEHIARGVKQLREKYGDSLTHQPAHWHSLFTYGDKAEGQCDA